MAYITDALRIITENTAKSVADGKYIEKRYIETLLPEDTRTEEDVIKHMKKTLKGLSK